MGDRSKDRPRRSVDQELAESEARYRALAESSPLAVFVVRNGEVILANPACVKLLGASSADALLGRSALELFDRDSQSLVRERMLVGSETVPSVEVRIVRLDGTGVDVEAAASPYLDQGVTAIQVLLRDITERKQAVQALAESEARYRLLTETSALGILVCRNDEHDDAVLVVNPASVKMFGASSADDLIGKSLLSLFAPDSRHLVGELLDTASGEVIPFVDAQILSTDLRVVDVSITAAPMLQDGLAAFNIVLQDVSAAKHLLEQQAKLGAIVESSPDAIYTKTLDEVITSWNPASEDLYGYTADEMIGCSLEVLMPPGHRGEPIDLIDRVASGHPVVRYVTQRQRKDGRVIDVVLTLAPVRDQRGDVRSVSVMAHDITESKRDREQAAHLAAIVTSSLDAIATRDFDGVVTSWNPAAEDLYGYTADEMIGKTIGVLLPPGSEGEPDQMAERLLQGDAASRLETQRRRKDGSVFDAMVSVSLVFNDAGEPTETSMFTRDITESKRAAELVATQAERIERTLNSVVDITSSIVELRDPYTAGHQRRVSELAVSIAEYLGVPGQDVDDIRVAALLHDMGKVAVPAELLTKPGALSPVEFSLIKAHPEEGHRLAVSANMAEPIAEMIYQHQERCDGSGYPRGLTGDRILLGSKVIAIADVVEAMVSHRPYRPALGIEAALAEIKRGSGALYDASASEACIRVFNEDGFEFSEPWGALGSL